MLLKFFILPLIACVLAGSLYGATSAWRTTVPNYPPAALAKRIEGQGAVRVTTDVFGWVKEAHMIKSTGSTILDAATVGFARSYWQGPPQRYRQSARGISASPIPRGAAQT